MSLCINPRCTGPQNSEDHLFCQNCGSELLLEGRYQVFKQRGRGGFGTTYEVRDGLQKTEGPQVFKILKVLTDNQPKHIELFQREAFLLSQLQHPGIPEVEAGAYFTVNPKNSTEPLHCIVMEKVVGLDLQDYLIKRGHPIDQKLALQWLPQIVEILHVLHQQHVLHRDIKPSNIMLKTDGHIALVDFGTARSVTNISGDPSGQLGTRVVSSFYTPREQMHGQAVAQSDFFALGRTFVYLLTGEDLGIFYDAATDSLNWQSAVPNLTPDFIYFLDYLMMPAVQDRPANTIEIMQALEVLLASYSSDSMATATTRVQQFIQPSSAPSLSPNQPQSSPVVNAQAPSSAGPASSPVPASPPSFTLAPAFVQRCQQELAEFIGPIAAIMCQQISSQPFSSERAFVDALAAKMPDPNDAKRFQQRMLD